MNIVNCMTGLENIGNICYLNTIIQLLNNIPELRQLCFKKNTKQKVKKHKSNNKHLTLSFIELIVSMNIETTTINPRQFKNVLDNTNNDFEGNQQHDCTEFLVYLLDNIHVSLSDKVTISFSGTPKNLRDRLYIQSIEFWNQSFKNEYSELIPLLFGQNKITMKNDKNRNNYIFESYNILTLSITKCLTLYDCFDNFIKKEELSDHKEYIFKYDRLWRLPKYLFIQLKRFECSKKINNLINFPINNLNLSKYCDSYEKNECQYNLIGVSNHIGIINFGHYTTYIKDEGKWYLFDDQVIEEVENEEDIISENAYLLLYEKII